MRENRTYGLMRGQGGASLSPLYSTVLLSRRNPPIFKRKGRKGSAKSARFFFDVFIVQLQFQKSVFIVPFVPNVPKVL
jgi:hypothetical protein